MIFLDHASLIILLSVLIFITNLNHELFLLNQIQNKYKEILLFFFSYQLILYLQCLVIGKGFYFIYINFQEIYQFLKYLGIICLSFLAYQFNKKNELDLLKKEKIQVNIMTLIIPPITSYKNYVTISLAYIFFLNSIDFFQVKLIYLTIIVINFLSLVILYIFSNYLINKISIANKFIKLNKTMSVLLIFFIFWFINIKSF